MEVRQKVRLIPMKNYDKKIITKRNNPLQRVDVLETSPLKEIADFVHNLAFPSDDHTFEVSLHVKIMDTFSKLPLSINVGEFMMMAHQETEGELRYSFTEVSKGSTSPLQPHKHVSDNLDASLIPVKNHEKKVPLQLPAIPKQNKISFAPLPQIEQPHNEPLGQQRRIESIYSQQQPIIVQQNGGFRIQTNQLPQISDIYLRQPLQPVVVNGFPEPIINQRPEIGAYQQPGINQVVNGFTAQQVGQRPEINEYRLPSILAQPGADVYAPPTQQPQGDIYLPPTESIYAQPTSKFDGYNDLQGYAQPSVSNFGSIYWNSMFQGGNTPVPSNNDALKKHTQETSEEPESKLTLRNTLEKMIGNEPPEGSEQK